MGSEFFKAAMKKHWTEGQRRIIELPKDEPDMIYAYVQWLYAGKIFLNSQKRSGKGDFKMLAKLYVFGEKIMNDSFQDCVLDETVHLSTELSESKGILRFPGEYSITIIYEGTPKCSPLRSWVTDCYVTHGEEGWVDKDEESGLWDVPAEFKDDVLEAVFAKRPASAKAEEEFERRQGKTSCAYHKHDKDEPCSQSRRR